MTYGLDIAILLELKKANDRLTNLPQLTTLLNLAGRNVSESEVDDDLKLLDASNLATRRATTVGSYTRITATLTPDGRHRLAGLDL